MDSKPVCQFVRNSDNLFSMSKGKYFTKLMFETSLLKYIANSPDMRNVDSK